jgi:hypothetical protein
MKEKLFSKLWNESEGLNEEKWDEMFNNWNSEAGYDQMMMEEWGKQWS